MATDYTGIDWDNIIQLFKIHKGTIISFCEQHDISHHQLYYYRKKHGLLEKKTLFHAISSNKSNLTGKSNEKETAKTQDHQHTIKIDIGKATLHINHQVDEKALSTIIKVLVASC